VEVVVPLEIMVLQMLGLVGRTVEAEAIVLPEKDIETKATTKTLALEVLNNRIIMIFDQLE